MADNRLQPAERPLPAAAGRLLTRAEVLVHPVALPLVQDYLLEAGHEQDLEGALFWPDFASF